MRIVDCEIKLSSYEKLLGKWSLKGYDFLVKLPVDQRISDWFYDLLSGFYDIKTQLLLPKYYGIIDYLVDNYIREDSKVLDLCTGTGNIALAASKRAGSVVAIDSSQKMLARAKAKARNNGNNIFFKRADITKRLSFEDNTFDYVCAGFSVPSNIYVFRKHNKRIMHEIFRVLKDGGRIILLAGNHKVTRTFLPQKEYHNLLSEAGFVDTRLLDIAGVYSVVLADEPEMSFA